jgi:SagB-type dehydrogenase family enzyme
MNSTTEQLKFFSQFFKGTAISEWEGDSIVSDSGHRIKKYPRLPRYKLPHHTLPAEVSLGTALLERHSAQELTSEQFSLSVLSIILASIGTRAKFAPPETKRRTYPSAGARYPGETYIITLRCEELPKGLYHYTPINHEVELLWEQDLQEQLLVVTNDPKLGSASVVLIFSLIYGRVAEKYGRRGLRYGLIELGHMAQNISLAARALQKGCCEIGGFVDSEVNTWLDVDSDSESAVLMIVLGGGVAAI